MTENTNAQRAIPQHAVPSDFAFYLWGSKANFQRRKLALDTLSTRPQFSKTSDAPYPRARRDVWSRIAQQSKVLVELKLRHQWSSTQLLELITMTDWMMPIYPQYRIFMSNLERQMSDEQKKIWVPMAERFEILGCYCQTELGHGSNVRGIETSAVFDIPSDEFVINSPSLSSTKYWIGAAGVWATHGIVVARLQTLGIDYGPHLFLVQLRDMETHRSLNGIEIYEQGAKVHQGMLGMDNGALRFCNVRVPRSQMLARNAQVLRDGGYRKPKNTKHAYGSMVTVRAEMAKTTGWDLLKPIVVAYHYTKFRKQFHKKDVHTQDSGEVTVFTYSSVKYRLMPLLATATALIVVGQAIKQAYDDYTLTMLTSGDTSSLEDLHLQTVASKVYGTDLASRGVETCRIVCGGHGYSALAGFGRMYAHTVNAVTYEGDNYVISQQVTKAIVKYYNRPPSSLPPSLTYLNLLQSSRNARGPSIHSPSDWFSTSIQQWALESRLARLLQQHLDDTRSEKDTSFSSHALTMAHSDYVYWKGFWKSVRNLEDTGKEFATQMKSLAQVFSLSILVEPHHPSLAHASQLSPMQLEHLRQAYRLAIDELATEHVDTIITAYGLTEYELNSALARTEQTPYEALMEAAQTSEMSGEKMASIWPLIVETTKLWKRFQTKSGTGDRGGDLTTAKL